VIGFTIKASKQSNLAIANVGLWGMSQTSTFLLSIDFPRDHFLYLWGPKWSKQNAVLTSLASSPLGISSSRYPALQPWDMEQRCAM
jgi:hypothetical protein